VDLNVHYHIHECVPLVPILSQSNLVHIHQSCFFKIHFTIILPSKHMCCKWPFSFRLPHRNLECISVLPHVCHMLSLFQPCCIYHPNNMWCGALVMNHTDSRKKNPTRCNSVSKFIIPYLYEAQPVSGNTPSIIRSLKLH